MTSNFENNFEVMNINYCIKVHVAYVELLHHLLPSRKHHPGCGSAFAVCIGACRIAILEGYSSPNKTINLK